MPKIKLRRLPNQFGSITKLKGNRSRPFWVRSFTGYDEKGQAIRPTVGFAASYEEALDMLITYNKKPYNLDYTSLTTEELFELCYNGLKCKVENGKLSLKRYKGYKTIFDKYFSFIHRKKFLDVREVDLQICFDDCPHGYDTKMEMKIVYNMIYDFAKRLEMPVTTNYVQNIEIGSHTKSDARIPFTRDEINVLWNNVDKIDGVDLILIQIYTGCRPNELFTFTEIHIEDEYFVGGSKTKAGKNRTIPIHKRIKELFLKRFILQENEMDYRQYYKLFLKIMNTLNMNHVPYECRHTFITEASNYKLDDLIVKLIVGHHVQDITKSVYTHKTIKQLVDEINKLP